MANLKYCAQNIDVQRDINLFHAMYGSVSLARKCLRCQHLMQGLVLRTGGPSESEKKIWS